MTRRMGVPVRVIPLALLLLGTALLLMGEGPVLSKGQTLYVPAYSHIYWGPKGRPFNLACTLSLRNTDPAATVTVTSVEYYDTAGKRIRSYLEAPLSLGPLATKEFYVEEEDTAGGSGANFLVRWSAPSPVNALLVECVMIGVRSGQGVSFTSRAREIAEPGK